MANARISDLTALTAPASGDLLVAVDISDTTDAPTGTTKKITVADLSLEVICVPCSDESTPLVAGTALVTFRMPFAMLLTAVRASLTTPAATGTITIDINEAGSTILSTKITIDATEETSVTAATPPVISDANLADDAKITIDLDDDADGAAEGLKVYLIGHRA